MAPSRETWQYIEENGGEISRQVKKWDDAELRNGVFYCSVTTTNGLKLQALLSPERTGVGYLRIPVTKLYKREGFTIEEVMAKRNNRQLDLKDEFDFDPEVIAKRLGFEREKEYTGNSANVQVYVTGAGDNTLDIIFCMTPTELRKGPRIKSSQAAIGVVQDFSDNLPGWKFKPSNKVRI